MKSISKILVAILVLLSFASCNAQIKNAKKETIKIYGNCAMCKKTIEKAGNLKSIVIVDWDVDTKIATLTYDSLKTNQDAILKRIALSGYDSDKFLAHEDAYNKLHGCCQYDRLAKVPEDPETKNEDLLENHSSHNNQKQIASIELQKVNQLSMVFDNYFALKDALVKTDGDLASKEAATLLSAINTVKMETLKTEEHNVWMKVLRNIKEDTEHIANTKEIEHQRDQFSSLSKNFYELMQVSKQETPTYYQFCPMAKDGKGANWLSKESTVKNPYYGTMMLSCGKVIETIK